MRTARAIFFSWLPLAGATTGILLITYTGIQQNYRQSLNDPQIQMAEDGGRALVSGVSVNQIVPVGAVGTVDLAQSLAPWIGVYDSSGKALVSSGTLDGAMPQPPKGIFEDTKSGLPPIVGHHLTINYPAGENRVTWQPNPDVRQALIVVYVPKTKEFVAAGRNMREVEERISTTGSFFFLGWLALMAATLFAKVLEYSVNSFIFPHSA